MISSLAFPLFFLASIGGLLKTPYSVVNGFDLTPHGKASSEYAYTSSIPPMLSSSSTEMGMISLTTGGEYDIGHRFHNLIHETEIDDEATFRNDSPYSDDSSSSLSALYMGPPVGAIYESKLRFPVLGTQIFSLRIQSRTQAHLKVDGKLQFNEPVQYSFNQNDGKLTFALSEQLKLKMRRYFTSLQEVGYDSSTDTPYVKVLPPLPAAIKILLKRV
jgi:hypothetical protein